MSKMKSLVTDLGWDGAERYLNQIRKDKKTLVKLAKLMKKEKQNAK